MKVYIRKCENYLFNSKKLKKLKKDTDKVFKIEDIKFLISIAKKCKSITEKNKTLQNLMMVSSYYERILTIKIDLQLIYNVSERLSNQLSRELRQIPDFSSFSKKDQEAILDVELGDFYDFSSYVDYRIDICNNSLDYLNSVQFNLKSVLSSTKGE